MDAPAPSNRARNRFRVISIALPPELLEALEGLHAGPAYSGRSEAVRAALQTFLTQKRREAEVDGATNATLTLHYGEDAAPRVTRIRHDFSDIIRTMVHNHGGDGACLEVLVLAGPAQRIRLLLDTLRGRDGVTLAEAVFVPPSGLATNASSPAAAGGAPPAPAS